MWQNLPLFPDSASTLAGKVDGLYFYLIGVSVFFTLLIAGLLVVFSLRYRRKSDDDRPEPIEGSIVLELTWTIIPLLLSLVMFGWGAWLFFQEHQAPGGAMDVYVTGKQWMWKIQHPTGQREINELHVPVGRPVRLTMTSEDVIHSFFIPAFRMKKDVVPGRYTEAWFEATEEGTYHLFCAEYCGTKHSQMIGSVTVMSPSAYEAWLDGEPVASDPIAAGAALWEGLRCGTCHTADESRGPSLAGRYGTEVQLDGGKQVLFDEEYIRESILRPRAKISLGYRPLMPTYESQLTGDDLAHLVQYVRSLSEDKTP